MFYDPFPRFKPCPGCGIEYPATIRYFHRCKRNPDGLQVYCKPCRKKRAAMYHRDHPEKSREQARKWSRENPERVKSRRDKWYSDHPDFNRTYRAKWRKDNREKDLQNRRKQYVHRRDQERARRAKYRADNPERSRESSRIREQRRRTKKLNLPSAFSNDDWRDCLEYFNQRCAVCERPTGLWHTLAMDHWIPLNRPDCPGTVPENIVPLCHGEDGCNNKKRDADPANWLISCFGARKAKQILGRIEAYFKTVKGRR